MIVPRAYTYNSAATNTSIGPHHQMAVSQTDAERKVSKKTSKKDESAMSGRVPIALTPPPSTLSKPVIIPTRTKNSPRRPTRNGATEGCNNARTRHDPSSVPPSTAALLAMTSTPEHGWRMAKRSQPKTMDRNITSVKESKAFGHSLSSSNPQTWDFLLSPPEEHDLETGSPESDATLGPLSSVRSFSTESMPSLAGDEDSISSFSNPGTPGLFASTRSERKNRSLSTSLGENCVMDHPLLPPTRHDLDEHRNEGDMQIQSHRAPTKSKTSFKSNLTASFRAIRSAARSISDFTAPTSQRDDFLSRSVLAMDIPFTDERRPIPSPDPPDPALRRYLNPISLSAAELHFHNDQEPDSCRASVQLQPYQPGARRSSNASSPPIFLSNLNDKGKRRQGHLSGNSLDTEDPLTSSSLPRQREPRENSDFLRVIVLEMNMRKVGKLSDASPGRARLWLPPRKVGKPSGTCTPVEAEEGHEAYEKKEREARVPERWAGVML